MDLRSVAERSRWVDGGLEISESENRLCLRSLLWFFLESEKIEFLGCPESRGMCAVSVKARVVTGSDAR